MEDVALQQVGKIGNARYDHRGQPNAVGCQVDAGNQVLIGQHRKDDAADGKELGKRNHLVVLHALGQFREGVFQLGEEQDGHYDHDVEPRRLRGHNGSNAVRDECDDDGSHSENMVLRLLHVIVQPEQQSQNGSSPHEQTIVRRVEDIEQITQNAYKGESAVGTEKRGLPFALQADFTL